MKDIEHGRSTPGGTRAPAAPYDGGGAAIGVDLTGIDPVHWAETAERVTILRAWCTTRRHTAAEAVAAAGRLCVGVKHFYRLVATWKRYRDVRRVSGHPVRRGDERGARSVAADAHAIAQRVIDGRGPSARFTDVLSDVNSMCAEAEIAAPSSGMVHRTLMRARQSATLSADTAPQDVAVGVVACVLPVATHGGTVDAPDLVLAVERPGGRIVAHRLVPDGDRMEGARALLEGLSAASSLPIVVSASLGEALDEAQAGGVSSRAGTQNAPIKVSSRSMLLSTTLGSYIDSIPIRHRRHAARAPGPWSPLKPAAAVTAIDCAVAAHNASRAG